MKKDSSTGIRLLLFIAALFVLLAGIQIYYQSKDDMREATNVAKHELEEANLSIKYTMAQIEQSVRAVGKLAWTGTDHPETLAALTESLLKTNNQIIASCISFEPYTHKSYGRLLQVYSHLENGQPKTLLLNGKHGNEYPERDWYRNGLKAETGYWSEPYIDGVDKKTLLVSYVIPIHNNSGQTIGTLNVDINLDWLRSVLEEAKPYPDSFCMLQTPKGMIIAGTSIDQLKDKDDHIIVSKPVKDENGVDVMVVTVTCPKKDIYKNVTNMFYRMLIISLAGLLLLGIIIYRFIKNARKLNELSLEKGMMEKEMNIAHSIQMGILRNDFPQSDVDMYATLKPMHEVGGDLYDYLLFPGKDGEQRKLYFIIGDVAGKSISAAMIMSATVTLFRLLAKQQREPADIIREINNTLSEQNHSITFVTAFVGQIDLKQGILSYCNAGHNQPFITEQDGSVRRMMEVEANIPLGYLENYDFKSQQMPFGKDTKLVFYTDGLNEAMNMDDKRMGLDRIQDIISRNRQATAQEMTEKLIEGYREFMGDAEQVDDITILCITK